MIKSIQIKNFASYDEKGIEITDLTKVNFFYGANGSGKTVISNYLYAPLKDDFLRCISTWQNDKKLKVLVYNKQFRDDNFGNGKISGVFTLGKSAKDEKDNIEKKKDEREKINQDATKNEESQNKKVDEKNGKEEEFTKTVWDSIYKKHESTFKEAFKGSLGSKKDFKDKLLLEHKSNTSKLESLEELKKRSEIIFGGIPERIEDLITLDFNRLIEIEQDSIWQKRIIGKSDVDIAKLIESLNISDWVSQGKLIIEKTGEICPFCQQETITPDFKLQIERYFDEEFNQEVEKVKTLKEEYLRLAYNIVNTLNDVEKQQKGKTNSKLNIEVFSAELKTLISFFSENKELLSNKIKEPSRSIELKTVSAQLKSLTELLTKANQEIKDHNKIVDNYTIDRKKLIDSIWRYVVDENNFMINQHTKEIETLTKGINGIETQRREREKKVLELDNEIKELTKNVTGVRSSVDSINATLKFYGFNNFKIVPAEEENTYQIERENGDRAERTLSEGEITFITFLYFLQLVKGATDKENILEDRIVIIDDPISSLDSNVLYVVSSLTKELIKKIKKDKGNVKQLFLLTHNVFFHKQVSFIDGRNQDSDDVKPNFWILRKKDKITSIQPCRQKNPIHTSYELLWSEIGDDNSIVSVQNNMRRIIEHYFKILGKYGDDKLVNKFDSAEEREICRTLLIWINEGSHGIEDPLFVEYQGDTIKKYKTVFQEIFIKTGHESHYDMMMGTEQEKESI